MTILRNSAFFQLELHIRGLEDQDFPITLMSVVQKEYGYGLSSAEHSRTCSFSHLAFETYASRYYSYLFSSAICLDILQEFLKNGGSIDLRTAKRYRLLILQRVGLSNAEDAISTFLHK